ncbi:unnamed protein product [Dovyalis caffra]|uniref:WD repeat-containing protein 26 n=1 Tax=Dovyalis caffra TaxID=77055 RepID=A0AAV1SIT9_9ROSI|nr:unnamed protein product [Dovyalis caffra]
MLIGQVLQMHFDEVWFLQFSPNGNYLASSSKDESAIIWEVTDGGVVSFKHILGHQKPVLTVSWIPNDEKLLTCGEEEVIKRWDVNSGRLLHIYVKTGVGFISCTWCPVGFILAGTTDESISLWNFEGEELDCWKDETLRVSEMAVTEDGTRILSIYQKRSIAVIDRKTKELLKLLPQANVITSFSSYKIPIYQQILFWWIEETFIASGTEDSQVYIWHRASGMPVVRLWNEHPGSVNCVSWNPENIYMLDTASDDHKIVIWCPPNDPVTEVESAGQEMRG